MRVAWAVIGCAAMELACSVDPAEHRGDGGALVDAGPGAVSTTDGGPRDGGLFDGGPSDAGLLDGGASAPDAGGAPPWVPTGYRLVWADEFDGPGSLPDATKWVYDTEANATGWYNHELQYYAVARPESSRVTGGHLIITARKERLTSASDYGGQNYSSARLITRGKSSWTYGFVDVRAKLPCGVGTWPAIWMLGTSGAWPAGGEIDIMEQVGKTPTTIYGTVHCQATAGTSGNGGSTNVTDACAAFHNYHVLWTPERLDFGVDGVVFHSYLNQGLGHDSWPFNEPQYLLLNLAIGGDMAGSVDDSIFPVEFQVDSARVYQKP